ncbi:MAG: carbon monoxide dehydrogenase [Betaproteobacteria bacterium RIFCSPLOWO2_02_FULL_65_24]|nr:MAG: carbon monoxide dehydrogenase [Betaproteobacteria bacterium RIFCSPLOWO2_02_FULL_65_24]OGA86310.1 MAG: carbon monoxide dehydrogenase [Betaproteobacteria bacterium RIFCSPLOWO2_12_FULL_66_14]
MNKFGIGQPVRRVEDTRFLTGRGRYVDDINLPLQAYGVVLLSPHAHARIRGIDTSRAAAAPGVLCVLAGADAARDKIGGLPPEFMPEDMGGPKGYRTQRPVLCADRVRFVGDRVAFVVAETQEQARDAAELIEVDYEVLPAVLTPEEAVKPDAPRLFDDCPTGNVSFALMFGNKEATDAAFATAKHVVSLRVENHRLSANSIEPRVCLGAYDASDDSYTLHTSSQNPHGARHMLSHAVFHIPESKLRLVSPDVGGGFGMKGDTYPEDALVLWASRRCGRPVKWVSTRSEALLGDNHGRDQVMQGELALDANGKFLALRSQGSSALGAYVSGAATAPIMFCLLYIPSVYNIKAAHVMTRAVFTNAAPMGPYRGAGRPEAIYLMERLVEKAARVTGIDAIELRRRNYIPSEAMPYTTATGNVYDSGDFVGSMDKCLELADWKGFEARRAASQRKGRLRGRGLGYFIEPGGIFNDRMELRFDPGGAVSIVAGTHSHGQGHATVYAQMVSDWLGVPFEQIRFVQGDTDQVPFGRGTYAARSSMVGGCALKNAADAIVEKARLMAAHLMEAAPADVEFKDGQFRIAGTDRQMPLVDVAKAFYRPMGLPKQFGLGLDAAGSYEGPPNFPNGCHACEVEIDPETGAVTLQKYAAIDDVGRALNPMICEGQIVGGVVQGIGQALLEQVVYDPESGQLLSGSFSDYTMPRADDLPHFDLEFHDVPATSNPLGVKGVGEGGAVGSPAVVIAAVLDALRPLGIEHIEMPATPLRVWETMQQAKAARAAGGEAT